MPERDREKVGLIEVRGRLMNLELNNIHYLISNVEPDAANTHFFQHLLHNGMSSGDSFQLFIIFNYSILTAMSHKEDPFYSLNRRTLSNQDIQ